MGTLRQYSGTTQGGYSGSVKNNWSAVDGEALAVAKSSIFNSLSTNPDVAFVSIPPQDKNIRDHGKVCEYPLGGKYTLDVTSQHEHTDKDWKGHFKNWQGSRVYNFMIEIMESSR